MSQTVIHTITGDRARALRYDPSNETVVVADPLHGMAVWSADEVTVLHPRTYLTALVAFGLGFVLKLVFG